MTTIGNDRTEVLTPTESRQASPKTTNFRVLIFSLAAITAIGAALVGAFWLTTPAELKSPAGSQSTEIRPSEPAPTGPAPVSSPTAAP